MNRGLMTRGAMIAGLVFLGTLGTTGCPVRPPLPIQACLKNPNAALCKAPDDYYQPMVGTNCPTGACDPISNGQGIYVEKGGNYCLNGAVQAEFCPEAFINTDGGVALVGWHHGEYTVGGKPMHPMDPGSMMTKAVSIQGGGRMESITSDGGELVIAYRDGANGRRVASGALVGRLTIELKDGADAGSSVNLVLTPGNGGYAVRYYHSPQPAFAADAGAELLCDGQSVFFLTGKRISPWSAKVTPEARATTFGCQSGAIAKCMNLGYTEWAAASVADPNQVNYEFASCLQAIRAAYFVGQGDYRSYTKNGVGIYMRDLYGIQKSELSYPEALWSPNGAECLNRKYQRDLEISLPDSGIPECGDAKGMQWTERGKLATGLVNAPQVVLSGL